MEPQRHEQLFFEERCPSDGLTLSAEAPPAGTSASVGGGRRLYRLASVETRGESTPIGNKVGVVPEILTGLTGLLGERVKTGLPKSVNRGIVNRLERSLREIRDEWGVPREGPTGIVHESRLGWGLGMEEDARPKASGSGHARRARRKDHKPLQAPTLTRKAGLPCPCHRVRRAKHPAAPDQLPETTRPFGPDNPLGAQETIALAKAPL